MSDEERCPCGRPLHYRSPSVRAQVEAVIDRLGPTIPLRIEGVGTWRVSRHWIVLHGVVAAELPETARRLGFEPCEPADGTLAPAPERGGLGRFRAPLE